jgi:EAL domain-containing protein (putative c-di-GMP-specific phosphodiesterase class I)
LRKALLVNGVDPGRLLFEVAESTINQNLETASTVLEGMAECKVRIAVDNFGARFAPLNHLARLPIDVIKLSPRLTATATAQGREGAVLESLVRLAQALGMQVIAQGIETSEQLEALNRMGCELGQGHLFAYALEPGKATILAGSGQWSLAQGA